MIYVQFSESLALVGIVGWDPLDGERLILTPVSNSNFPQVTIDFGWAATIEEPTVLQLVIENVGDTIHVNRPMPQPTAPTSNSMFNVDWNQGDDAVVPSGGRFAIDVTFIALDSDEFSRGVDLYSPEAGHSFLNLRGRGARTVKFVHHAPLVR